MIYLQFHEAVLAESFRRVSSVRTLESTLIQLKNAPRFRMPCAAGISIAIGLLGIAIAIDSIGNGHISLIAHMSSSCRF